MSIARRELWDVRVQLMAEEEDVTGQAAAEGLGSHDVKTGVYEGGFKSWESSVDLVKLLAARKAARTVDERPMRVIEVCNYSTCKHVRRRSSSHTRQLGCGTALPSIALFQWITAHPPSPTRHHLSLVLADYNPTVLQLVTLPNFLLSWALTHRDHPSLRDSFSIEGEVELGPAVVAAFQGFLAESNVSLSFASGGWSLELVDLLYAVPAGRPLSTLLLGAETIYSPFALDAFLETLFVILRREEATLGCEAGALVAAKRLYFGVGGSLDDFVDKARARGALVNQVAEETEGVRRGVVHCILPPAGP